MKGFPSVRIAELKARWRVVLKQLTEYKGGDLDSKRYELSSELKNIEGQLDALDPNWMEPGHESVPDGVDRAVERILKGERF